MKAVTFIGNEQSEMAGKFVAVGISVFLAKVAVTSGTQLPQVIAAGPALHFRKSLAEAFSGVRCRMGVKRYEPRMELFLSVKKRAQTSEEIFWHCC